MNPLVGLIILVGCFSVMTSVSGNCSESLRPKVILETQLSTAILPYISALFLNSRALKRRYSLTCSSLESPVRWDIHSSDPSVIEVGQNLYWKNPNNEYFGHITVFSSTDRIILTCHAEVGRDLECSTRSVLYQHSDDSDPQIIDFINNTQVVSRRPMISNESSCGLVLVYRVVGTGNTSRLEYKWEGQVDTNLRQQVTKTASSDYFRGLYSSISQRPRCVKQMTEEDLCGNDCRFVHGTLTGVIFHAEVPMMRPPFVAKGVFGVFSSPDDKRHFYWEWEILLEHMVKIDAPSVFFVNKTENVTCTVSGMFFAYGTIINVQSVQNRNKSLFQDLRSLSEKLKCTWNCPDKLEVYVNHGIRKLSRSITFRTAKEKDAILCTVPLIDFSQVFSKTLNISVESPEAPVILHDTPGHKETLNEGEAIQLKCRIKGKPRPTLIWTFPTKGFEVNVTEDLEPWEVERSVEILNFQAKHEGTYKCTGKNYMGSVSSTFELELRKGLSSKQKVGLGFGLASVLTLFVFILVGIYGKIIFQRQKYLRKTFEAKGEFLNGISGETEQKSIPQNRTFVCQPFDDSLNVPFNHWTIEDTLLGSGNFGLVRKGRVRFPGKEVELAVKTLRSAEDIQDFRRFLYELKLMKCIGCHPNIVCLIACCVERIDKRDVMIGVELCTNGSIEEYLHQHRSKLKRFITGESSDNTPRYKNTPFTATPTALYKNMEDYDDLDEIDLYTWAFNIADGMEFLASKLVLHGDLAVRNVLLNKDKVAKISDFGLSRHLDENATYKKKSNVEVPWRHLPIESFTSRLFSTASDVWAYGVTVWEIFSLGQTPYHGVCMGQKFIDDLISGMRLTKPHLAPDFLYEIMGECWHVNSSERPSFVHLKHLFGGIVEQLKLQTLKSPHSRPELSTQIPPNVVALSS